MIPSYHEGRWTGSKRVSVEQLYRSASHLECFSPLAGNSSGDNDGCGRGEGAVQQSYGPDKSRTGLSWQYRFAMETL